MRPSILLAVLLFATVDAAAMIRCRGADGRIEYSDRPACAAGERAQDTAVRPAPPMGGEPPAFAPEADAVANPGHRARKPRRKSRTVPRERIWDREAQGYAHCRALRADKTRLQERLAAGRPDASLSELRAADARLSNANCPPF